MAITGMVACTPKGDTNPLDAAMAHDDGHDHAHDFACPMHPDMRGHQGEQCNICAMPLEQIEDAAESSRYSMDFTTSTNEIHSGQPVSLSFRPRNSDKANIAVPLDVTHEKKIHLIIVNETLSWFDHIHPEFQADGSYLVEEVFPDGGSYVLYADYKPSGGAKQLEVKNVTVEGKPGPTKTYSNEATKATTDLYSISLVADEKVFYAGKEIHFDGIVTKNGDHYDVNEFQNYLGSTGHMVAIHVQNKTFVHIHAEIENEKLHFHASFPEPGAYRLWLQFKADDVIHTADFTVLTENRKDENSPQSDRPE